MSSADKPTTPTETEAVEGAPSVPPKDTVSSSDEAVPKSSSTAQPAAAGVQEEDAPPKPPRPAVKLDQDIATLKEAFPDTETNVIKAVLQASGGKLEVAFNALLGMTDPNYTDENPPPQPPRPVPADNQTSTPLTQLESDELYARQLAEHYSGRADGGGGDPRRATTQPRPRSQQRDSEEREYSFLEDDLPVIKENIKKGFLETQSKVNKWVAEFKRKLDGEESEDPSDQGGTAGSSQSPAPRPGQQFPPRGASRRSGDAYDADPRVIDEDFSHLELRDNTGETQQRSSRPIANPNLFTSDNQQQQQSTSGRKVSFQEQTDEDLYRPPPSNRPSSGHAAAMPPSALRQPSPTLGLTGGGSAATPSSKWAPLEAVEPTPLSNDPFSLGDSDDDHETAPSGGKTTSQETSVATAAAASDTDKEKK